MLLNNPYRFGGFSPLAVGGLQAWWDATDASTITGTDPVTAWVDKSANALVLVDDVNGPNLSASPEGGQVFFDRSNTERMKVTSAVIDPASGDWTMIVVFQAREWSGTKAKNILCGKDGSGSHNFGLTINDAANGSLQFEMSDGSAVLSTIEHNDIDAINYTDGQVRLVCVTFDATANVLKMYADDWTTDSEVATDLSYNPGAVSPTDPFYVGTWDGATDFFEGGVGQICFFDNVISDTDRNKLEAWARGLYDLTSFSSDPGLPAIGGVNVTGHWSSWDAADRTESGGEVTQLDDLSGNANHMTRIGSTFTAGPKLIDIDGSGRTWLNFEGVNLLGVASQTDTDPGAGDQCCICVFRTVSRDVVGLHGKIGTGNPHYLFTVGAAAVPGQLYNQIRDAGLTPGFISSGVAAHDYAQGNKEMSFQSYDDSLADMRGYGRDQFETYDEDLAWASATIAPTNPLFIGSYQDDTGNRIYTGQIAEVIYWDGFFNFVDLTAIIHYLKRKWGFYETYVDPGLPASVSAPEGWWSTRSVDDYTMSGSNMTQLTDKSGNARHFTPGAGTGPTILEVQGRNWASFESATPTLLRMTDDTINPDADDLTVICVYRSGDTSDEGIVSKDDAGSAVWGVRKGAPTVNDLRLSLDDGTTGVDLDDATDHADDVTRIFCATYDDSLDDAYLFTERPDDGDEVASSLAYVSGAISPLNDMYLGSWGGANVLNGEIAECLVYHTPLTEAQRQDIYAYLRHKWGF